MTIYNKMHNVSNGYFNQDGVPYHSVETLICEAPDYGHMTTSEAVSYYIWMETMYGYFTADWSTLNTAYSIFEQYLIPGANSQPNISYNPESPADFVPEGDDPSDYPEELEMNCPVGLDPLHDQLSQAYGTSVIYGSHWLTDADNWYGYGRQADGVSRNGFINTFQRGKNESVWKTIPQPEWEIFKWGGQWGFLDLFTKQNPPYSQQWRYTNAPDADARIIQAFYWAYQFSQQQGLVPEATIPVASVSKLGDFLRYSMFDKYFKNVGSQTPCGSQTQWYGGFHGLLSWYYSWGGNLPQFQYPWGFRIGCEYSHFGYQNPMAAMTMQQSAFAPKSSNGVNDWQSSLSQQINFYSWLQSSEGAIAGGATSSWNGRYDPFPSGVSTFAWNANGVSKKMAYMVDPSYDDPPSNEWFGWQAWSMERVAEYYYVSQDPRVQPILQKWATFAKQAVKITATGVVTPGVLNWSGQPDNWNGSPPSNQNLHVSLTGSSTDIGVASALAQALSYWAAASGDTASKTLAQSILDTIWNLNQDNLGVSAAEERPDYCGNEWSGGFFNSPVYVPQGWSGKNAQGANIAPGATFLGIRPKYQQDPKLSYVQQTCNSGGVPTFNYHRFWAVSHFAIANADFSRLFPNG